MPVSEAKKRADAKYRTNKRRQIQLDYSIEEFEQIKQHCEARQTPVATWCKAAIQDAMRRDQDDNP